jgi:hypothetical protein
MKEAPTMPTDDKAPVPTVADLVAYWTEVRENGPLAATTVSAYLGAIARILRGPEITAETPLAELDLPALTDAFTAAHPDLKSSTLTSITAQLRAAINGYSTRHGLDLTNPFTPPAPESEADRGENEREREGDRAGANHGSETCEHAAEEPGGQAGDDEFDGTLAHLERFTDHARRAGVLTTKTASVYRGAIRRILASAPHLAAVHAADADPLALVEQYAERNPHLAASTISNYRARLVRVIAAYTAHLAEHEQERQPPASPPAPPAPGLIEIPLPGERTVRFSAPPDLTSQEARATLAVLSLHHPGLTAPPAVPGTWTLVFWPEHAPDEPEAAHLTGPSFRRALADHIREHCPELTGHDDDAAIDAWYATEVFVALAFTGHHHAHDSGTLL